MSFEFNVADGCYSGAGRMCPLPPKVFDLLLALVERHGQVVTKDQLLSEVWPDTFVEETNLKVYVSTLRKVLSDGSEGATFIETLPKRGYRFAAPVIKVLPQELTPRTHSPDLVIEKQSVSRVVIEEQVNPSGPQQQLIPKTPAARLPILHQRVLALGGLLVVLSSLGWFSWTRWGAHTTQVGSLAVMPFTMLAQSPDEEHLGIGLTDALITRLSNVGGLVVRPTSAVLKFTAADRDALALGRKLGVDAVLDGHLQRSGEQVRLTVQLQRTQDGAPLWAQSFEEPSGNLFALQRAGLGKSCACLDAQTDRRPATQTQAGLHR
jgi:DNA-binding winged helix-turn-helix (wHTH) protein/TolB-like protein